MGAFRRLDRDLQGGRIAMIDEKTMMEEMMSSGDVETYKSGCFPP
jgi:hypothetical protein